MMKNIAGCRALELNARRTMTAAIAGAAGCIGLLAGAATFAATHPDKVVTTETITTLLDRDVDGADPAFGTLPERPKWSQLPHNFPFDCCFPHNTPGCNASSCQDIVCAMDPNCCSAGGSWDVSCVQLALAFCDPDICTTEPMGFNVASNLDWQTLSLVPPGDPGPGPNIDVADDFVSDGRQITSVRWWGSYIDPDFEPNVVPQANLGGAGNFGACCFFDGSCFNVADPAECEGGVFLPQESCPEACAERACCYPDGSCADIPPTDCVITGGTPQGPSDFCADIICPITGDPGACCRPDVTCIDVGDVSRCVGGAFFPGVSCADDPCDGGGNEQACCLPDGSCVDATAADCINGGGAPQGAGTNCATTPCPLPDGACCLPDGTCIQTPPAQCLGVFQGNGTSCLVIICPQLTEACCFPDGTCLDLVPTTCTANGGIPAGAGTACATTICLPEVGACCLPDGSCIITPPTQCPGIFQGVGTICADVECPQPPTGACCAPVDGTIICIDGTTQADCKAVGGIYQGDGTVCIDINCDGDPGTNIDGWLISFHAESPTDIDPPIPGDLLGLYFCPEAVVSIELTDIVGWDGHRVYEYYVDLDKCKLLHSEPDPRDNATTPLPARPGRFLETRGFLYWLDIQAVVGHDFQPVAPCFNCDCDLNGDNECNAADLAQLLNCFGSPPVGNCAPADINCDGRIDNLDLAHYLCLAEGGSPDECGCANICQEIPTPNRAFEDFWGWHTSPDRFNGVSQETPVVMGPNGEWFYPDWTPVDGSQHELERVNQAFELLTPCNTNCPEDCSPPNGNGQVNIDDLFATINEVGCVGFCSCDVTPAPCGNGVVNFDDIIAVINAFGACP